MATALPPTGDIPDDAGCDSSDLIMLHNAFRHLYDVMPAGVRGTPQGARRRVADVAANIALVGSALHHHHQLEDDTLWDRIDARRPACAMHVAQMKEHHAQVAAMLVATPPLSDAWVAQPGPATAEPLAEHLAALGALLRRHLAAEEADILPVVDEVFSQAEWDAIGREAQKAYARSQIFLFLGLIQDSVSGEQLEELQKQIPGVIKWMYRVFGRRQYVSKMDLLSAGTAKAGHFEV